MTVGGLFEGIGGFALAAQWAGFTPIWSNEIDPLCCKVLRNNFTHRIIEDDIRNIGKHNLESVDVLTGGFPCQPFSTAGQRKGTDDDRYLWPEMLRVVREIQPTYIVGENVYGLVNWSRGMVFDKVQADLEAEGYEVAPVILPACAVDAPHRRDRVWFVAYSNSHGKSTESINVDTRGRELGITSDACCNGYESRRLEQDRRSEGQGKSIKEEREWVRPNIRGTSEQGNASDPNTQGLSKRIPRRIGSIQSQATTYTGRESTRTYPKGNFREFPTQSAVCGGDDGLPNRVDRIKALGNAIVPQVAYEIFQAIKNVTT